MPAPKDPTRRKEWIEQRRKSALEQFKDGMPQKTKDKIKQGMLGKSAGERNGRWKGDEVGVQGKHFRVIKLKGKASNYKCVDCPNCAQHWSNIDHKYSLNPDDYLPRCNSCHQKYDNQL